MKKSFTTVGILCSFLAFSQTKKDSTEQKSIKEVKGEIYSQKR
jgi:hypothetical protein